MAVIDHPTIATATEPGWFDDPLGEHNLRYFDGTSWTDHVTHFGPTPCTGCADRTDD
ncbi:MAG: DUF2510 domain-containing protein [Actinomycetota bacterium]